MPVELRAYASLRHYFEHLEPVLEALQTATTAELRGVHAPPGREWGVPLPPNRHGAIWLVAGAADAQRLGRGVPVIYLEHGAGQSYPGDPRSAAAMSYSGGAGLDDVILFLCPSEQVAARWRTRYPRTPAVVVGAPKLDRWHSQLTRNRKVDPEQDVRSSRNPYSKPEPTVAVTFHWPNTLCPETQWAIPHHRAGLPTLRDELAAAGVELIGHGHPRAWRQLRREWTRLGIRPVENLTTVFDQADLLVVDNSSAGPEFASLGRPIVWVSAPWYRRHVHHGGRFWDWTQGVPHVEDPGDLADVVLAALAGGYGEGHARMVASAYAHTDGLAADRAVAAIMEVCGV